MNVCDICKNPSMYHTTVSTNPDGGIRWVDLCGRCYQLLYKKENQHKFLAYQETVEEVTNKPAKKTLMQRLRLRKV